MKSLLLPRVHPILRRIPRTINEPWYIWVLVLQPDSTTRAYTWINDEIVPNRTSGQDVVRTFGPLTGAFYSETAEAEDMIEKWERLGTG